MKRECVSCDKEISDIHLLCDGCASELCSENIFWIGTSAIIGEPVINRCKEDSKTTLRIGESPDGKVIHKEGKKVLQEILDYYNMIDEGEGDYHEILVRLTQILTELGITLEIDEYNLFLSPQVTKVLSEIFYMVEEVRNKTGEDSGPPELYIVIGNLFYYLSSKADSCIFSPEFRKKIVDELRRESEIYYKKASSKENNNHITFRNMGINYLEIRKLKKAVESFEKALRLDEDDLESRIGAVRAYVELDELESAEKLLNNMLENNPDDPRIWYLKAYELRKGGRWGGAIQFCEQALARDENFVDAILMKGEILLGNEMYREANETFDKGIEKDVENSKAWFLKAKALHGMNKWGGALQCLQKVLSFDPQNESAWVLRGDILNEKELFEEAMEAYEMSIKIVPDLERAKQKIRVCKSRLS